MEASLKRIIIFFSFLVVLAATIIFFIWKNDLFKVGIDDHQEIIEEPEIIHEKEYKQFLPLTTEVFEHDTKPENYAYRLWFEFMNQLKEDHQIEAAFYNRFHFLEGDDESFIVAVVFQVKPLEASHHTSWGEVNKDGIVEGLVWKMSIHKTDDQMYTVKDIEESTDRFIGLPPVDDLNSYLHEAGIQEPNENYDYAINDQTLSVTYNAGEDWEDVPVTLESLFGGEYNSSTEDLIEGSYIITPDRTAFVLAESNGLYLLLSTDQGQSWDKILISDQFSRIRMRLLGFTSEQDGYLIITHDRTMSFEGNAVLKTNDHGQTWKLVGNVKDTDRLVTDGGFVDNDLGFMSFGSIDVQDQSPRPVLYRTIDGGANWNEVNISIPDEYEGIFISAKTLKFHDDKGTLVVQQGADGDYLGGKLMAKFISEDRGETWTFESLIDPDNVLGTQ